GLRLGLLQLGILAVLVDFVFRSQLGCAIRRKGFRAGLAGSGDIVRRCFVRDAIQFLGLFFQLLELSVLVDFFHLGRQIGFLLVDLFFLDRAGSNTSRNSPGLWVICGDSFEVTTFVFKRLFHNFYLRLGGSCGSTKRRGETAVLVTVALAGKGRGK